MRVSSNWKEYEILDASDGEKLERWGKDLFIRPDPQILWKTPKDTALWQRASAHYHRASHGGGQWEFNKKNLDQVISYREFKFYSRPTGFKHMGLFPEQAVNWDFLLKLIPKINRQISVLNLFAYTGGATVACANAGAQVCHVDASKGMTGWARENAALSGLADRPIRWIVDDCEKFVRREIKRQKAYDGIIMDPPSYGRGPNKEVWKLEEQIYQLVDLCSNIIGKSPKFFILNSYSTGLSPSVMAYILGVCVKDKYGGIVAADEIGLPVESTGLVLPCGSTAMWLSNELKEYIE